MTVNGVKLGAGDGLAISDERELKLATSKAGQMLLFDLN